MQPASNHPEHDLAARAAWLSYIGGYTQSEIAERLQVSRAKAHRLVALAHQLHLVKVFIDGEPAACAALEERLIDRFGLRSCRVAPDLDLEDEPFAAVGAAAARLLHGLLGELDGGLLGVGKGRSLTAMVEHLPRMPRPDLRFVSISGSPTRKLSANPFDVVHRLVERTGGEGYFLPVPYIAADAAERKLLLQQKSVGDLMALAGRADLFVIGVGALAADAHVKQVDMVDEAQWRQLAELGAVGDLLGSFIDRNGRPVKSELNQLAVGLGIEQLKGKRVIAVVGGRGKGEAIAAALRTGVITDLVCCESAARQVADGAAKRG